MTIIKWVSATGFYFFLNFRDRELIQYLCPVGWGPSSKTWPRCEPQRLQTTSARCIPRLLSSFKLILALSIGCQNLGQPEPESYLVSEENNSCPQAPHQ